MLCLVLCEESQTITKLIRNLDIECYSCDLQKSSGGFPQYHIIDDCLNVINGNRYIRTENGNNIYIGKPDVIIAHPPCTYLTSAGSNLLFDSNHNIKDLNRYELGIKAAMFFNKIYHADIERICIENPTPIKIFNLPKYSMIISPDECGSQYSKRTCLWLKNIPLFSGDYYKPEKRKSYVYSPGIYGSKLRSKTDQKLAECIVYNIFLRTYIY